VREPLLKVPASEVTDYYLFANRRAYTLQSSRHHPENARHYYRPKAIQGFHVRQFPAEGVFR
jgi:hypothetical protein